MTIYQTELELDRLHGSHARLMTRLNGNTLTVFILETDDGAEAWEGEAGSITANACDKATITLKEWMKTAKFTRGIRIPCELELHATNYGSLREEKPSGILEAYPISDIETVTIRVFTDRDATTISDLLTEMSYRMRWCR